MLKPFFISYMRENHKKKASENVKGNNISAEKLFIIILASGWEGLKWIIP